MSCKKDDFISILQNDLQNLTEYMMPEVCKDTKTEPRLTLFSGEVLHGRTFKQVQTRQE